MGDSKRQQQVREHRRREVRLRNLITFAIEHIQEGEHAEALVVLNGALVADVPPGSNT